MWRQVFLPPAVVGTLWLIMSGTTTYYVHWLDSSYQRSFSEHLISIQTSGSLQELIWKYYARVPAEMLRSGSESEAIDFHAEIQRHLQEFERSAVDDEERRLVAELTSAIERFETELSSLGEAAPVATNPESLDGRSKLLALALEVSQKVDDIRHYNQRMMEIGGKRRDRISYFVIRGRGVILFLGCAFGLTLGWWTAQRLNRSVAQIRVTLNDPLVESSAELGTVTVRGEDLGFIHRQVETVVQRLRTTGEELRDARREVVRAERLAAIGGLAAGVAHELRNPLTSVKLLLQHAANHGGDATVAAPRMRLILEEIERMEGTIQGLLDFSRPARMHRSKHDLRETLQRAVNLVEGKAMNQNVTMRVSTGDEPVILDGDPQLLHQVFVNLLLNAIEAMPEGGELDLIAEVDRERQVVPIRVMDTGKGICEQILPQLFEPFATTKDRGTGLGLAVSRRIVQEHGGAIVARGRAPHGTVFEVTLPVAVGEPAVV